MQIYTLFADIKQLTDADFDVLEGYCKWLKPVVCSLDFLQGETECCLGYLILVLITTIIILKI